MNKRTQPALRESGVSWIGKIPSHWDVRRVKWTVSDCANGIWGNEPDGVDDVVCVRVADFDRDALKVRLDAPTMRAVEPSQRESRQLRRGDLLIEKSGGGDKQLVGCVVQFNHDVEAVCSNFVARMPVESEHCARYWCYVHASLYSGRLNYPAIKQTTGIQNLDASAYLNTLVACPPLPEQERISDFLGLKTSQIDALITKKRALIERLKEKRLAVITQAVTKGLVHDTSLRDSCIPWLGSIPAHWKTPPLSYRYSVELGKMLDEKRITRDALVPYLRNVDVQWDSINFDDLPEMDISGAEYNRYTVASGDILVCEGGEVGRCAIVHETSSVIGFQKALHRLRPLASDEDPRFMYYSLFWAANSGIFNIESASTIAHLTAEQLRRYRLPQPSFGEQQEIARFLDQQQGKWSRLLLKAAEAIEQLLEYRSALITAAVTGKLDVPRHDIHATA